MAIPTTPGETGENIFRTDVPETPIIEGTWTTPAEAPDKPIERMKRNQKKPGFKLTQFLCSFVCFPVSIGFAVAMIVIGGLYVGECPAEPVLPYLLIIYGVLSLVFGLERYANHCMLNFLDYEDAMSYRKSRCGRVLHVGILASNFLLLFMMILFAVFVYTNFVPSFNRDDDVANNGGGAYCDRLLYVFSFAYVTFSLIFLGLFALMLMCCCCCLSVVFALTARQRKKSRRLRARKETYVMRKSTASSTNTVLGVRDADVNAEEVGGGGSGIPPDIIITAEVEENVV